MDETTKQMLVAAAGSALRHALTLAAGWLAAKGIIGANDGANFVEIGSALVVGIGAYAWSVAARRWDVLHKVASDEHVAQLASVVRAQTKVIQQQETAIKENTK